VTRETCGGGRKMNRVDRAEQRLMVNQESDSMIAVMLFFVREGEPLHRPRIHPVWRGAPAQ
jgi:hypothetical protein